MSKLNQINKDKRIVVRTTISQLEAIKKHSKDKGLSVTQYILGLIYENTKDELLNDYSKNIK